LRQTEIFCNTDLDLAKCIAKGFEFKNGLFILMIHNIAHVAERRGIVEFDMGIHHEITHGFNFIINRPVNSLHYLFVILRENLSPLLILLKLLDL